MVGKDADQGFFWREPQLRAEPRIHVAANLSVMRHLCNRSSIPVGTGGIGLGGLPLDFTSRIAKPVHPSRPSHQGVWLPCPLHPH